MSIRKWLPRIQFGPVNDHFDQLADEINRSAQLEEEVQRLIGEVSRLSSALQVKTDECNTKAEELVGFLSTLGNHAVLVDADRGDSYYFDVQFRPNLTDPANLYTPYDCDQQGYHQVFSHARIAELQEVVKRVGLDDWKVGDCSYGFNIKRRFTLEGIYTLAEALKTAESQLQRLVNEYHRLKVMGSVLEAAKQNLGEPK